jgi:Smg protein
MLEKQTLLTALMFVFENYIEDNAELSVSEETIADDMLNVGFEKDEINQAIVWFDGLVNIVKSISGNNSLSKLTFRAFSEYENNKFTTEARGLLLYLEQNAIIDPIGREMIIDRCLALNETIIEPADIKWVALLVLFSQGGKEEQINILEDLVLFDTDGKPN